MKTWTCIQRTYWGETPKTMRLWKVGETLQSVKQPNKHFISEDKVEETFKFDEKDSKDVSVEDMSLMTKKQINDKFELGIGNIQTIKKEELIKMAINKTKVLPKA